MDQIEEELVAEKAKVAQLEVQLAGCAVVALGYAEPDV